MPSISERLLISFISICTGFLDKIIGKPKAVQLTRALTRLTVFLSATHLYQSTYGPSPLTSVAEKVHPDSSTNRYSHAYNINCQNSLDLRQLSALTKVGR